MKLLSHFHLMIRELLPKKRLTTNTLRNPLAKIIGILALSPVVVYLMYFLISISTPHPPIIWAYKEDAQYILSALAQAQGAIFGIFFSLNFIIYQIQIQNKGASPKSMREHFRSKMLLFVFSVFSISIILDLILLRYITDYERINIFWIISLSLFALLLLLLYMYDKLLLFFDRSIVEEIRGGIVRRDLSGANLKGEILDGLSLEGVFLVDANLEKASLRNAKLSNAKLNRANLKGADLYGIELKYAKLIDSNMERAELHNANLKGAILDGSNLKNANFDNLDSFWWPPIPNKDLSSAILENASLKLCNLERVHFREAKLKMARLNDSNLKNAFLKEAKMEQAILNGAKLKLADLEGAMLKNAKLIDSDLEEANLSGANLEKANLTGANLRGVKTMVLCFNPESGSYQPPNKTNLNNAILVNADLEGADLRGANLDGINLKEAKNLERALFPEDFDINDHI